MVRLGRLYSPQLGAPPAHGRTLAWSARSLVGWLRRGKGIKNRGERRKRTIRSAFVRPSVRPTVRGGGDDGRDADRCRRGAVRPHSGAEPVSRADHLQSLPRCRIRGGDHGGSGGHELEISLESPHSLTPRQNDGGRALPTPRQAAIGDHSVMEDERRRRRRRRRRSRAAATCEMCDPYAFSPRPLSSSAAAAAAAEKEEDGGGCSGQAI